MANNDVVRARIDSRIKEKANTVLEAIGLTASDAFRMLMTRIAEEEALPFEPLTPNVKTIKAIKEARLGKGKSFKTVDDLMADLDADH
jgi:DNA-damage-inducible protein J